MFEFDIMIRYAKKDYRVIAGYSNNGSKDLRKDIELKKIVRVDNGREFKPKNRKVRNTIKELIIKKINLI